MAEFSITYASGKNRTLHTRGVAKSRSDQATKAGKHGTLRLFRIRYSDSVDSGCPEFSTLAWRYDLEHLVETWQDSLDGESWQITGIEAIARQYALDHGKLAKAD